MGCGSVIAFGPEEDVHLVWTGADGNTCGWCICYSHRDEQGWTSREIVGENYDYDFSISHRLAFHLDSDEIGHLLFAGCKGEPVMFDSDEVYYYAVRDPYDIGHVVFLLNYLYKGGPAPSCLEDYDFNCDEQLTLADVISLLNYLFKGQSLFGFYGRCLRHTERCRIPVFSVLLTRRQVTPGITRHSWKDTFSQG